MMIKYIADIIIIMGCGYIGVYMAGKINKRITQLNCFEAALKQLSFNIGFLALPIREAVLKASETQEGVTRKILENITGLMLGRPDISLQYAWQKAICNHKDEIFLKDTEILILEDFLHNIGQGDKNETLNSINAATAKLHLASDEAKAEQEKNGKLYKGMGFLAGILIVILLY